MLAGCAPLPGVTLGGAARHLQRWRGRDRRDGGTSGTAGGGTAGGGDRRHQRGTAGRGGAHGRHRRLGRRHGGNRRLDGGHDGNRRHGRQAVSRDRHRRRRGGAAGSGGTGGTTPPRGPTPAANGVNFPFPQNRENTRCAYPTGYLNSDVTAAYAKWKTDTVTSSAGTGDAAASSARRPIP